MSLFRAEKLIDLACSSTHEEEARTAALAACKLIRKHGLRLTDGPVRERRTPPRSPPPSREPPRAKPPNGGVWMRATRSGKCESCGGAVEVGDDIYVVAEVVWCGRH